MFIVVHRVNVHFFVFSVSQEKIQAENTELIVKLLSIR